MSNVLDAAGHALATVRYGTDASIITNATAAYNTAGELVGSGNGVGDLTTYTNFFDGSVYRVEVATFPDTTTRTNSYFLDGQSYQSFGSGVFPITYLYGATNDSAGRLYTIEQRGSTTEWTLTVRDMLGRHFKTLFASASAPHPYAASFYDSAGKLNQRTQPDGNIVRYGPDSLDWYSHSVYDHEESLVALDLDRNSQMDFAGTDRITKTSLTLDTSPGLGVLVRRTASYEWKTNGVDSPLAVSVTETTPEGLHSLAFRFGLTNRTDTVCAGGGIRYVTNTLPDGTYSLSTFKDGRLLKSETQNSTLGTLNSVTFGYDAHGRQNKMTNAANGTVTAYEYDKSDRATNVIVSASGLADQSSKANYDNMGRVARTVEPDGTSKTNEYYATGLPRKKTGSREYPVEYAYDSQGRITNMTTWQGYPSSGAATTAWKYDAYRGFMTNKVCDGGAKGPSYTYDAVGRLTQRTWARGTNTTYTYNDAGDLLTAVYSDGTTPNATNSYDRRGRLVSAKQGGVTNWMSYNDAGLLTSETFGSVTVSNIYNSLLRRITNGIVNSAGTWLTVVTNNYDAASRLLVVSDRTNSATYSYLATNTLIGQITFAQSGTERMVTCKAYDGFSRLTSISHSNSPLGIFDSYRYAYNTANQRIAVTNVDNSRWNYSYDALGQLTAGKKYWSDSTIVAGEQFEYAYDDIGNRKTAASGGDQWGANLRYENYAANNLNQYTSRTVPASIDVLGAAHSNSTVTIWSSNATAMPVVTTRKGEYFRGEVRFTNSAGPVYLGLTNIAVLQNGTNADIVTTNTGALLYPQASESFTYDLDGNTTSDSLWTNTWNAENRSLSAESRTGVPSTGKAREAWSYAADGRWIERIVSTWNGSAYTNAFTNRFVWDGHVLLAILDHTNGVALSFLRGLDLSGTLQGAGGVGGLLAVNIATNGTNFAAFDGNGNVMALVSTTDGSTSADYEYDLFGNTLRLTGTVAVANPIRFSTQYESSITRRKKYLHRELTTTGRWLSRDPIMEEGGKNTFAFTGNDAVNRFDAFGLYPKFDSSCGCTERNRLYSEWFAGCQVVRTAQFAACFASKLGVSKHTTDVLDCLRGLACGRLSFKFECVDSCSIIWPVCSKGIGATVRICRQNFWSIPPPGFQGCGPWSRTILHEFLHLDACGPLLHPKTGEGTPGDPPEFKALDDCYEQVQQRWN